MRKYILLLLLTLLLTSCATKVEIDIAQPVEKTTVKEPVEITKEEPKLTKQEKIEETNLEENTIEIKGNSFYPKEKIIEEDIEIKWINKDKKEHKIACYLEGTRVTTSPNLKEEGSFTYTFSQEGEYTCIDAIYGLRSTIIVNSERALLSPTGSVVGSRNIEGASLAAVAFVLIIILLFLIYNQKRK